MICFNRIKMKSTFYSRNNSYSRSCNAEVAESQDRFPLTRAAQYLGLSSAAFKAGLSNAGISTNEWHHVGKYANRVDYYDVSLDSEIVNSFKFWKGAITKANKALCLENMKRIAHASMLEKTAAPYVMPSRYYDRSVISVPQPMTDKAMWRAVRKAIADKRYAESIEPKNVYANRIALRQDGTIDWSCSFGGSSTVFYVDLNDYTYTCSSGSGKTHYFVKK